MRAASKQKWLEAHGIEHWTHYYTDYGRELQLRFFDHFLHGKTTRFPRPGRLKTVSTTNAPPSRMTATLPTTVSTWMSVFRKACQPTTAGSPKPFARAVRT